MNFYSLSFYGRSIEKDNLLILACALIFPAIFFSPFIFSENPQFNFFGDLYNLYFPQFVEGYNLAKNSTFQGIDFLTNNGASVYFLRPNIPAFNPIYQLTYLLFEIETIKGLAYVFVFILYFHSVVCLYFTMRLGLRFFQMDKGVSLVLGTLYFGAIACSYPIPPFYFAAALFPLILYFTLLSSYETLWWRFVLYSFPYVLVFLSGYVPVDVNSIAVAFLFSVVYIYQKDYQLTQFSVKLAKMLLPVGIASIVVFPIYLAMVHYHELVPGLPKGVWFSAHELAYQAKDFFALFSKAFKGSHPGSELPHITIGLLPIFIVLVALANRRKLNFSELEARIIYLSMTIFVFYLLLAFGHSSGLPDLFYFLIPGLGKMHLYGRYLPVASFFFYLVVAISFKNILRMTRGLSYRSWLIGISIATLIAHIFGLYGGSESLNAPLLVIQLIMILFALISLMASYKLYSYIGVISVTFFIHSANFNSYTSWPGDAPYQNTVVFSEERQNLIRAYFKKHSDKDLVKYADLTSSIEKLNGVMLNYPWMVQDKIKLSNYMGYELHTSVDKEYLTKFPYFGKVNVDWILRTGADFIIYDQAAWATHSSNFESWIDKNTPELDLWYGYKAAKLKSASGVLEGLPILTASEFDNGIFHISGDAGSVNVKDFQTDYASYVRFDVDGTSSIRVRYLLFPNKLMKLQIDGEKTDIQLQGGLIDFVLPAGHHKIEYIYSNILHQIFTYEYIFYLILLFAILVWRTYVMIRYRR